MTTNKFDRIASVTMFLVQNTGSCLGVFKGKMTAHDQRALFGRYFGKGQIVIDGTRETIGNRVKVCFGHDYDDRNVVRFIDL